MTILLDATVMELRATGIAKATLFLYKQCLSLLPDLQVCAIHRRPLNSAAFPGIHSKRVASFLPNSFWRSRIIPMMAKRENADAIHFPWSGHVPLLPSNVSVVTTLHDVLPLIIPRFFKSDEDESQYRVRIRRDIERTHLLMTDSEFSKKEIVSHFQPSREPVVVPLGPTIEAPFSLRRTTAHETASYFLYVGGYDPRKGLEALLTVFLALSEQKRIASRLILTGEQHYYSEQLRTLIVKGTASGAVEERGYVSDNELAGLLMDARALVYPSKYEGFGLPPLEAMSLGCPVITTRYTSLSEVCGDAARYIEPENDREFADALLALETNEELRSELKKKGTYQAGKFTWEISANKYLAALGLTLRRPKESQVRSNG